jgi:hypothetical protein
MNNEIERLQAANKELQRAVGESELQLKTAMLLLKDAICSRGDKLNGEIWRNRLKELETKYYGYK